MLTFQLTEKAVWYRQIAFDADGLRAVAVDASGKVVIWDIDA